MAKAHLKKNNSVASDAPEPAISPGPLFWRYGLVILAVAAALRLLWLGRPAYHPDEAIHALEAYNFVNYHFNPIYHGPLLYHLEAVMLRVCGDSDFTARLVPALLGIGLVALVLCSARRWMGHAAALWGAALLAISPVLVAYSRRLLHDALVLVLTLAAVLYFQAARENSVKKWEGREARAGVVLMLTLFLATKANAFFVIAMLVAYWISLWLRPREGCGTDRVPLWTGLPLSLFGIVAIAAMLALRGGETQRRNEMCLMGVSLVCCGALWEWLRRAKREESEVPGQRDLWAPVLAIGISGLVFAFLYGRGYLWLRDGISRESIDGALGAMPSMLAYWKGQQGKPRLPGPHDYYIVLALMYELPIVIAGACGVWRASRVRTPFTDLLLWWCFTSFAVYALANEKVPWLLTHQILPLALLGGVWLGSLRPARWTWAVSLAGTIFLLRNVAATSFGRPGDMHEPMYYAQTTDAFGDSFQGAMQEAVWGQPTAKGGIWIEVAPGQMSAQWPCAWYLRRTGELANAPANYDSGPDAFPGPVPQRLAVMRPETWYPVQQDKFPGWRTWNGIKYPPGVQKNPDFLVWQRSSWPALYPPRYWQWWVHREATRENGVLAEWSNTRMVVATRE